ncbi:hypothetical protein Pcinc_043873 [Petrolisthes cinctipes]|uniref:Uncharacterized protein n=1 Tax=Petrolisthes cinctipes TaxID=88211 RepID=A0AAE1EEQ9_PETCI|nr:hypothetical protein Pcinc_043873 [Petrolisthes cinctipes]
MGREGATRRAPHKHTSRESTKLWVARCRRCYYKRSSSRLPTLDSSRYQEPQFTLHLNKIHGSPCLVRHFVTDEIS